MEEIESKIMNELDEILQEYGLNSKYLSKSEFFGIVKKSVGLYLPNNNYLFNSSKYGFNPKENQRLVHFTSIEALSNIVNSKILRIYNLQNLNDSSEFVYSVKIFNENITNEESYFLKQGLFQVSFCENAIFKTENRIDEFNMWYRYGEKGKGAAIEFEIENEAENWENFHLGRVFYGDKKLEIFRQIKNLIEKYNEPWNAFNINLYRLYMFHKTDLFESEKEIRLFFDKNNGTRFEFLKPKTDLTKTKKLSELVEYIDFPLKEFNNELAEMHVPKLRIKKIIFGYDIHKELYNTYKIHIKKVDSNIKVEQSLIREEFYKENK
jgi:hypothetical protein